MLSLKKIVLSALLLFFAKITYPQQYVDLIKINYSTTPFNRYDSLKNINTQVQEFSTDITLPIVIDSSKTILTGMLFEQISLMNTPRSAEYYYTINPKIGLNLNHSSKITGTYLFLPKISSDLRNSINKNSFQFGGIVLLSIKKSHLFKYRLGIYANQELFGPFVVPLFGFYYLSNNKKMEANFTLPVNADLNYKISDNIRIGLAFNAIVKSFLASSMNNNTLTKTTNELFAYFQFYSPKYRILVEPQIGHTIGRSFRMYNSDDKLDFKLSAFEFGSEQKQLNFDFKDGYVFKIRLVYRFVVDNN